MQQFDLVQNDFIADVAAAGSLDFFFISCQPFVQSFLLILHPIGATLAEVVVLSVVVGHEALRGEVDEAKFEPDRGVKTWNSGPATALAMGSYSNLN